MEETTVALPKVNADFIPEHLEKFFPNRGFGGGPTGARDYTEQEPPKPTAADLKAKNRR